MSDKALHGQCLCGGVKYTAHTPISTLVCHCKDCQRQSGSAFSIVALFLADNVDYAGSLSTYTGRGESGLAVHRLFCPTCGSAVVSRCDKLPGIDIIKCGTLDDTSVLQPAMQIYCDSQQTWVELPIDLRYPRTVPEEVFSQNEAAALADG